MSLPDSILLRLIECRDEEEFDALLKELNLNITAEELRKQLSDGVAENESDTLSIAQLEEVAAGVGVGLVTVRVAMRKRYFGGQGVKIKRVTTETNGGAGRGCCIVIDREARLIGWKKETATIEFDEDGSFISDDGLRLIHQNEAFSTVFRNTVNSPEFEDLCTSAYRHAPNFRHCTEEADNIVNKLSVNKLDIEKDLGLGEYICVNSKQLDPFINADGRYVSVNNFAYHLDRLLISGWELANSDRAVTISVLGENLRSLNGTTNLNECVSKMISPVYDTDTDTNTRAYSFEEKKMPNGESLLSLSNEEFAHRFIGEALTCDMLFSDESAIEVRVDKEGNFKQIEHVSDFAQFYLSLAFENKNRINVLSMLSRYSDPCYSLWQKVEKKFNHGDSEEYCEAIDWSAYDGFGDYFNRNYREKSKPLLYTRRVIGTGEAESIEFDSLFKSKGKMKMALFVPNPQVKGRGYPTGRLGKEILSYFPQSYLYYLLAASRDQMDRSFTLAPNLAKSGMKGKPISVFTLEKYKASLGQGAEYTDYIRLSFLKAIEMKIDHIMFDFPVESFLSEEEYKEFVRTFFEIYNTTKVKFEEKDVPLNKLISITFFGYDERRDKRLIGDLGLGDLDKQSSSKPRTKKHGSNRNRQDSSEDESFSSKDLESSDDESFSDDDDGRSKKKGSGRKGKDEPSSSKPLESSDDESSSWDGGRIKKKGSGHKWKDEPSSSKSRIKKYDDKKKRRDDFSDDESFSDFSDRSLAVPPPKYRKLPNDSEIPVIAMLSEISHNKKKRSDAYDFVERECKNMEEEKKSFNHYWRVSLPRSTRDEHVGCDHPPRIHNNNTNEILPELLFMFDLLEGESEISDSYLECSDGIKVKTYKIHKSKFLHFFFGSGDHLNTWNYRHGNEIDQDIIFTVNEICDSKTKRTFRYCEYAHPLVCHIAYMLKESIRGYNRDEIGPTFRDLEFNAENVEWFNVNHNYDYRDTQEIQIFNGAGKGISVITKLEMNKFGYGETVHARFVIHMEVFPNIELTYDGGCCYYTKEFFGSESVDIMMTTEYAKYSILYVLTSANSERVGGACTTRTGGSFEESTLRAFPQAFMSLVCSEQGWNYYKHTEALEGRPNLGGVMVRDISTYFDPKTSKFHPLQRAINIVSSAAVDYRKGGGNYQRRESDKDYEYYHCFVNIYTAFCMIARDIFSRKGERTPRGIFAFGSHGTGVFQGNFEVFIDVLFKVYTEYGIIIVATNSRGEEKKERIYFNQFIDLSYWGSPNKNSENEWERERYKTFVKAAEDYGVPLLQQSKNITHTKKKWESF